MLAALALAGCVTTEPPPAPAAAPTVRLYVSSTPPGAAIFVNDRYEGRTDDYVEIPVREDMDGRFYPPAIVVRVSKPNHRVKGEPVRLNLAEIVDRPPSLDFTLVREAARRERDPCARKEQTWEQQDCLVTTASVVAEADESKDWTAERGVELAKRKFVIALLGKYLAGGNKTITNIPGELTDKIQVPASFRCVRSTGDGPGSYQVKIAVPRSRLPEYRELCKRHAAVFDFAAEWMNRPKIMSFVDERDLSGRAASRSAAAGGAVGVLRDYSFEVKDFESLRQITSFFQAQGLSKVHHDPDMAKTAARLAECDYALMGAAEVRQVPGAANQCQAIVTLKLVTARSGRVLYQGSERTKATKTTLAAAAQHALSTAGGILGERMAEKIIEDWLYQVGHGCQYVVNILRPQTSEKADELATWLGGSYRPKGIKKVAKGRFVRGVKDEIYITYDGSDLDELRRYVLGQARRRGYKQVGGSTSDPYLDLEE